MKVVYAKHLPYDDGHLGLVVQEMELYGPPTIRIMEFEGELFAVEGSHRLAAAHYLDLTPKLVLDSSPKDGLEKWWRKIMHDLPKYEFGNILVLDLR